MHTRWIMLAGCALALQLTGCGGGGSGSPAPVGQAAPPAPTLSLDVQPIRLFRFSWNDVADGTSYRLLESVDGTATYSSIGTFPVQLGAYDLDAFLPLRVNASYILEACNSGGCTASAPVVVDTAVNEAIGYFKASNSEAEDRFGASVALSHDGRTMAVGANLETGQASGVDGDQSLRGAGQRGAVYVFVREAAGQWSQQAYVKASNSSLSGRFGQSVALAGDGDTLAVGDSAEFGGAVYLFTRQAGVWTEQAHLKASNPEGGGSFGFSVALSDAGEALAVGAHTDGTTITITGTDDDPIINIVHGTGAAYVFTVDGAGQWSEQAFLKPSADQRQAHFGARVALSADGNLLAVGAPREDVLTGSAYVFVRDADTWSEQIRLQAGDPRIGDRFGDSVALSADGTTLAVGTPHQPIAIPPSVQDPRPRYSGTVYIHAREGGAWPRRGIVRASNAGEGDYFGNAVSLSADGDLLAVGAFRESSAATAINGNENDTSAEDSGAVYVFSRQAGAWTERAYLKATNTAAWHQLGSAVALSGDGATLAAAAPLEGNSATGVGGDQHSEPAPRSGAVYLY